jgi:hypothetical protein
MAGGESANATIMRQSSRACSNQLRLSSGVRKDISAAAHLSAFKAGNNGAILRSAMIDA